MLPDDRHALKPLIQMGTWGALVGGSLRVLAVFIPYTPGSGALEALYGVIDVCLLFGLIAIYLESAAATGRTGLVGFAVALVGTASIVGPDAREFGIDFYILGSSVFLLGLAVLALRLLSLRHLTAAANAWLLAAGLAILAGALANPLFVAGAGLALGLGFALAGARLLALPAHSAIAPG